MLRQFQTTLVALMVAGAMHSAQAFSMLGPYEAYQVQEIGYNTFGFDIGGPMNLAEEYRWNMKTITYGFDSSFKNYFGQEGMNAVNKAFAMLNSLPAFSAMSSSLAEYPTDTRRSNYRASALGLMDLKSATLGLLMEELGLASPDRYVWALRDRRVIDNVPFYLVIKRNFDPVTFQPSSYVNGVLYTYAIVVIADPPAWDAVEVPVDPLAFGYTAVASDIDSLITSQGFSGASNPGLGYGEFYSGLTRDDVGGLRYLYRPNNYNVEDLVPGTTLSATGGSPWWPVGTTPTNGTPVGVALRPGVDHISFVQAQYDSIFGNFITLTNQYQDTYISNNVAYTQTTQRVLTQPDILFTAEDLGLTADGSPIFVTRTFAGAPVWVNNSALNGQAPLAGPGVINGQVVLAFSKLGPHYYNAGPYEDGQVFLDEFNSGTGFIWGSFDGTTNAPIVYPSGTSIMELEQYVLGGN